MMTDRQIEALQRRQVIVKALLRAAEKQRLAEHVELPEQMSPAASSRSQIRKRSLSSNPARPGSTPAPRRGTVWRRPSCEQTRTRWPAALSPTPEPGKVAGRPCCRWSSGRCSCVGQCSAPSRAGNAPRAPGSVLICTRTVWSAASCRRFLARGAYPPEKRRHAAALQIGLSARGSGDRFNTATRPAAARFHLRRAGRVSLALLDGADDLFVNTTPKLPTGTRS